MRKRMGAMYARATDLQQDKPTESSDGRHAVVCTYEYPTRDTHMKD